MKFKEYLQDLAESRGHNIIANKLKTMELLKKGVPSRENSGNVTSKIKDLFADKVQVEVGEPKKHTFSNHNNIREYLVYPVTYKKDNDSAKVQTFVNHAVGTSDVKLGLPTKLGGDKVSIE